MTVQATRELKIDDLSSLAYSHLTVEDWKLRERRKRAGENIQPKEECILEQGIYAAIASLKAVTTVTYVW